MGRKCFWWASSFWCSNQSLLQNSSSSLFCFSVLESLSINRTKIKQMSSIAPKLHIHYSSTCPYWFSHNHEHFCTWLCHSCPTEHNLWSFKLLGKGTFKALPFTAFLIKAVISKWGLNTQSCQALVWYPDEGVCQITLLPCCSVPWKGDQYCSSYTVSPSHPRVF